MLMVSPFHCKNPAQLATSVEAVLNADTIIATCGCKYFEKCPAVINPGLLTPGHRNYDKEAYSGFMHSFRVHCSELCEGRNIILIDCTVIENPEHDKALRNHLGTNPETWAQVVAHDMFTDCHDNLTKLSSTKKNLVICVCRSGCHRSLASAYSIEHVIQKVHGADRQNKGVEIINLHALHHQAHKCKMCRRCWPTRPDNDANRDKAYLLLKPLIHRVQVPQKTVYWRDRRVDMVCHPNVLPPIARKRRHSNDDWSPTSSGGAHPTIPRAKFPRSTPRETSQCWPDAHDKTPKQGRPVDRPSMPSGGVHPTRKLEIPRAKFLRSTPRETSQCRPDAHDKTPKQGRPVDHPSMPSGGVHPSRKLEIVEMYNRAKMDNQAKIVVLFIDSSTYPNGTSTGSLTSDTIAKQIHADVSFTGESQNSHEVQWQVVRRNRWHSMDRRSGLWQEALARKKHTLANHSAETTTITLARPSHLPGDIHEVRVIVARIINVSRAVTHELCKLLRYTTQPALVLASVGTSTATMKTFVQEYNDRNSSDKHKISFIHNDRQAICLALTTVAQARQLEAVEITATTEPMIAMQLHIGKVLCTEQPEPAPKKQPRPAPKCKPDQHEPAPEQPELAPKRKLEQHEPAPKKKPKSHTADARQEQDDAFQLRSASQKSKKSNRKLTEERERLRAEWADSVADAERKYSQYDRRQANTAVDLTRDMNSEPRRADTYTARNNDGVHLVDNQKQTATEPDKQKYRMMLANVDKRPEDEQRKSWIKELRKQCSTEGKQCTRTLDRMQEAFDILERARNHVGERRHGRQITEQQVGQALEWMQYDVFEVEYMTSVDIKRMISREKHLKGSEKTKLHHRRRGAFKAWKWQLLGSPALLDLVLRHGYFDAKFQRLFLLTFEQMRDNLRQTTPTIDVGSPIYKEYQSKALEARHTEKTANKMATFYVDELADLPPEQQAMLDALASGALLSNRQRADEVFGHGRDVIQKSGRAMYRSAFTAAFIKKVARQA